MRTALHQRSTPSEQHKGESDESSYETLSGKGKMRGGDVGRRRRKDERGCVGVKNEENGEKESPGCADEEEGNLGEPKKRKQTK